MLTASILGVVSPAAVQAAAQPSRRLVCPESRPDEASALSSARACRGDVMVAGDTTDTTQVVATPAGNLRATLSASPVRMRRGDKWVPIDLTLRATQDGSVSPVAAPNAVRISGRAGAGSHALLSLGAGAEQVSLGWTGPLPTPVLAENRATYVEVRPGVDLVAIAGRGNVEVNVVVKNRAALSHIQDLEFTVSSAAAASYREDADGNIALRDAKGRVFARTPQPQMWDAASDPTVAPKEGAAPAARPRRLNTGLTTRAATGSTPGAATLSLNPDRAWLQDSARVFPVTLDPTINPVSTTFDTYVDEGSSADHGGANDLHIGVTAGNITRSFLAWDTTAFAGKQITASTVYFYNFYSQSCTAASWELWKTGKASADPVLTWSNQPAWLVKEASSTSTKGFSSTCDDGWISIDGKNFFADAASSGASRGYMGLRATDESATSIGFKQVRSRNADLSSQVPYASVTYNSIPTIGTRSTTPSTPCATGTSRPYIGSKTPTLKAVVSDSEGTTSTATFEWWAVGGTAKIGSASQASVASGAAAAVTVPSGAFAENGSYMWRVNASDGTGASAWSSWCEFTVDTTAPSVVPNVSSTDYPTGTWAGAPGTAGTFTLGAAGVADVASYLYGLDTNPPTSTKAPASLGAAVSVSVTPSTAGPHTLYVQSVDRAGNKSAVTGYAFNVGSAALLSPAEGATSASMTQLQGTAPSGVTGATFQWRRADTDTWTTIPAGDVKLAAGGGAVTWPVATSGGTSPALNWNVKQTLANANSPSSITGRWLLNETSGTTAADSSGKGHDATASTGVSWSGDHGGSAVFSGSGSSIAANAPVLDTAGSFTVAAWVYLTSNSVNRVALSQSGNQQAAFTVRYTQSNNKWVFYRWADDVANPTTGYHVDASVVPQLNAWTHLAATFDRSTNTMAFYVNGALQGTRVDPTPFATSGPLVIGSTIWNGSPTGYWKGNISDVQAYTAALSASQVATIAKGGQAANTSAPLTGPLQVRATFTGGSGGTSPATHFTFDPTQADAEHTSVGPGQVNLLTGDVQVTGSDVAVRSYGSDLSVSRSFASRQVGTFDPSHMFGPGWTSTAVVPDARSAFTGLTAVGSLVQLGLPDGSTAGFTQGSTSNGTTSFVSQPGNEELTLSYTTASDRYTLADRDGNVTTFTRVSGAPAGQYAPTSASQPGSAQTTTMTWETATVDGVTVSRPTQLLAPVPSGVACAVMVRGCRGLTFSYAGATTATGTDQAGWGDYAGRLQKISFTAWDPATSAMRTVDVSAYAYDSAGRLTAQWDPRLDNGTAHLWTTYTYNADGTLATVAPQAQPAWNLTYTTVPGDLGAGRLAAVSRSALTAGTATTTVVYRVPLSGTGAPYAMDSAATSRWGQSQAPVYATAVFDPGQVPTGDQAGGTMPSSWTRATVRYMDANGRTTDTVVPGGYTTATWYDAYGNTVRRLTAANLAAALNALSTDSPDEEAALAAGGSTIESYAADGVNLLSTVGPAHSVLLSSGQLVNGREVTLNTYDEGAPSGVCPCGLVTTEQKGVQYTDGTGIAVNADLRTTTTAYDWNLRQPTTSTVDPGAAPHLNLATRTAYDATTGAVTSTTTPGGGTVNTTPSTTMTIYYRSGTGSGYAECDSHPEWANLVCRSQFGGQSATGPELPVTVTTYDLYNQQAVVTEKTSAATLRTTTTTYDSAGRRSTVAVVGAGAAVPTVRYTYDPTTGLPDHVQSLDGGGAVTAQTTTGYDPLGRVTSYTDTDGVQSTTTYDLQSRVAAVTDGIGTRTYTYDQNGENRGKVTQVVDSQAGTITASYDASGFPATENWPNGVAVTRTYDSTARPSGITYTSANCGQADCTLYTETRTAAPTGDTAGEVSTLADRQYRYDAASRLVQVNRTYGGQCFTKVYGFDAAAGGLSGNRTSLTTYDPDATGACQTTTAAGSRTWSYDSADRVTTSGYAYDVLGRTTIVPQEDTQVSDGGAVTIGYYVNDRARSIGQGTAAAAVYALDVDNARVRNWADSAGVVHVNHYDGDDATPSWTDEGGGLKSRPVAGSATLAALVSAATTTTVTWQVTDLRGDIVATTASGLDLSATYLTDGFGVLEDGSKVGATRYAWLGGDRLAADNPAGLVLMGARVYNPASGRFLSIDPVSGGNSNPYVYCTSSTQDCKDVTGEKECHLWIWCGRLWNDMWFSVRISHHRNANNRPTGSYRWLRPDHTSTEYWKDNDMLRVAGHWTAMHDQLGTQAASKWWDALARKSRRHSCHCWYS